MDVDEQPVGLQGRRRWREPSTHPSYGGQSTRLKARLSDEPCEVTHKEVKYLHPSKIFPDN